MADDVTFQTTTLATPPNGTVVAADVVSGVAYQRTKPVWGVDGSVVDTSASNPLPVVQTGAVPAGANVIGHVIADSGSTTAITGNVTVIQGTGTNLKVDASSVAVPVTDNSGSLTVDGTVAATQSGTWTVQPGNTANSTAWKVDASSVAVPITDNSGSLTVDNAGTFAVQSAQSGTWTVQPGNTANTTAWKVDGSAVTQPVSVASIPSHAVTNAGTFAVQATIASGATAIAKAEDVASADADVGVPGMAV